jgi:riboflavin biosynthesis pyrimidine reductase
MSERPAVGIERLYDVPGSAPVPLPEEIERLYDGPFALAPDVVLGNFVTSIDGVAAIAGVERSSAVISGGVPADRFVMGLLRAVADAVVIGSGTLREHAGPWTAERAFPDLAAGFTAARRGLKLGAAPTLVAVTSSGRLPADHPALGDAIVLTTSSGARTIAGAGVSCRGVVEVGEGGEVDVREGVGALRERGFRRILTEGGPRLMGSMLAASVVEELFLTVSPKLLGGGPDRPPLTGDVGPAVGSDARLLSARRAGDHLLLRYGLTAG